MAEQAVKSVPAVRNALAILEFLRVRGNEPATLSEIARATSINLSTCYNLLKTLEGGRVIAADPSTKTYRLGLYLAELGSLVDRVGQTLQVALDEARRVSGSTGLGCFLMTRDEQEHFVVRDRVESRQPIRVTIDIGAAFPPTGAVAAKAWFAWSPPAQVTDLLRRHPLPGRTPHSVVDADEFIRELRLTRQRGYSTSRGEYYPDHNAVAAAVFGHDAHPELLLVVVGTTSQLTGREMARVGDEVAAAAERATKRIGGQHPRWHDSPPRPGG
ncbi:MAG TPA: IclR family transcriptional regulator [Streptosporangiaceae bacterium]